MTSLRITSLFAAAVAASSAGCRGQDSPQATGDRQSVTAEQTAATPAVQTVTLPATPCDWIPAAEVAAILGELKGTPERVRSAEQPSPMEDGWACLYRLAARPRFGGTGVIVEVSPVAGVLFERAAGAMQRHFAEALAEGEGRVVSNPAAAPDQGWDYTGHLPTGLGSYVGRVGHLSVFIVSQSPDVPRARLATLAATLRDRIPDLPFPNPPDPLLQELNRQAGEEPEPPPSGPDPCSLVTRAEAEQVLGPLTVAPYRSAGNSPLVDPHGNSCTYFTKGHRALVLMPHWESGKMTFGMARQVGGMVASVLPEGGADQVADTLDGSWDEAAANSTTGDLYFLKGDRMLEVTYLTSSSGPEGAVRLASIAVGRL